MPDFSGYDERYQEYLDRMGDMMNARGAMAAKERAEARRRREALMEQMRQQAEAQREAQERGGLGSLLGSAAGAGIGALVPGGGPIGAMIGMGVGGGLGRSLFGGGPGGYSQAQQALGYLPMLYAMQGPQDMAGASAAGGGAGYQEYGNHPIGAAQGVVRPPGAYPIPPTFGG